MKNYNNFIECNLYDNLLLNENLFLDYIKKELPNMNLSEINKFIKNILSKIKNISKRKIYITTILTILLTIMSSNSVLKTFGDTDKETQDFVLNYLKHQKMKSFDDFVKVVGFKESSNDWKKVKGQYLGYFQFGLIALKDIGYDLSKYSINKKREFKTNFLNSPELQKKCFIKLMKKNESYLSDIIKEWDGKTINGIKVTKSGILMGSHLVGNGKTRKFFESDGKIIPKDGNKTPITSYLKEFSGYDVSII